MEDELRHLKYGVRVLSSVTPEKLISPPTEGSCQKECYFSPIEGEYFDVKYGQKGNNIMEVQGRS